MLDPSVLAPQPPQSGVPWATVVPWVLGAIGVTATAAAGAFRAIWAWGKAKQDQLVEAYRLQATSAENRATRAEIREDEARKQYDRLKGEFKATTRALRLARRQEEVAVVGEAVSTPPPDDRAEEEHTGNYFVDSAADRAWFEEREQIGRAHV